VARRTAREPTEDTATCALTQAFIVLALLAGGSAHAQTATDPYPSRPVRMIVPFAAGGPGDTFARLIAQKLSEQLGRQFFVENHAGAGGNIGTGVAARAPADGHTLLVGSSTVWVNASLYPHSGQGEHDQLVGRAGATRRQRAGRDAENRDELAPLHSITSSARVSSASGTVMPNALAVLRLMISSTFVAC
jgi:hypothetical protein